MIVIAAAAPDDAALWASTADTADGASNEARLVVVPHASPTVATSDLVADTTSGNFVCRVESLVQMVARLAVTATRLNTE